jgi:hypothetical protein
LHFLFLSFLPPFLVFGLFMGNGVLDGALWTFFLLIVFFFVVLTISSDTNAEAFSIYFISMSNSMFTVCKSKAVPTVTPV